MEESESPSNDAIHYEILFELWLDANAERKRLENFVLRRHHTMKCHCCEKKIKEDENFIIFHSIDEVKRYAGVLIWKERKREW